MSDNPYKSPESSFDSALPTPGVGLDFGAVAPLCLTAGWLKFLGILNIVFGVLYCLTIIGLIIGWLPIWIGITLNKASHGLREGYARRNQQELRVGMDSLALVIKIYGVLAIIGLVFNVLYFGFILLAVIGKIASSQM